MGHRDQHDFSQSYRPCTATWPSAVMVTMDRNTASSGNTDQGNTDQDQHNTDHNMSLGGTIDHIYQHDQGLCGCLCSMLPLEAGGFPWSILPPERVLMSVGHAATEGHVDVCGLC